MGTSSSEPRGEPAVDAVVPVFGESTHKLIRTVEALLTQKHRLNRIVVVDDGSPAPVQLPSGLDAAVSLTRLSTNSGIAAARNHGAAHSQAEYLLFVNCEVSPRPDWVLHATNYMVRHRDVAAVGGAVVPRVGPAVLREWRMRFLENPEQRGTVERSVGWLSGHATLVRRSAFEEVGGYDRRLRESAEDHNLCVRLAQHRFRMQYLPDLVADSYEVPTVDLFARKTLRNSGWMARRIGQNQPRSPQSRSIRPGVASSSVIRSLANHAGRDVWRCRWSFLPVDVAVAARSLYLVWAAWLSETATRARGT